MHDSNIPYEMLPIGLASSSRTIGNNKQYSYVGKLIDFRKERIINGRGKEQNTTTNDNSQFGKLFNMNCEQVGINQIPIKPFLTIDNKNYSRATNSWIGYVTSVNEKTFTAKVEDLKSNLGLYEDTEILIEDINEDELQLLKIGSVFYWSIGYEFRNGTKTKGSFIRFKNLPEFTEEQTNSALDLANDLMSTLNWDD